MIARSLLDQLQQLNREEKLEVIRFLTAELAAEESKEWDSLLPKQGGVARIPSVRADFNRARRFLDLEEDQTLENA